MMFVAEFVQRLHPYFKHYKENNAKKSFMQHLLRKCYNLNEKKISEPSALRFYNGIVEDGIIIGDNICSFAAKHINLFDVKSASDFIAECTKDIFNKDALCAEFSDVIPDIDINNYPAKLASQLKTLLENAANKNTEQTKNSERSSHTPEKQAESINNDIEEAFAHNYNKEMNKEMRLSKILPGIRSEIWKAINEIINTCQDFKIETDGLYRSIEFLKEASTEENQAKITSYLPIYLKQREEIDALFHKLLNEWANLYKTYSNIIEIKEITQIDFASIILIPPDNRAIHVASSQTDAFIEKLTHLSETFLFT